VKKLSWETISTRYTMGHAKPARQHQEDTRLSLTFLGYVNNSNSNADARSIDAFASLMHS
jgi:hypothetical protein